VNDPELVIDAIGRRCPIPVIELAKQIGQVEVGHVVRVLADDPAAKLDIPAWCDMRAQEYLGSPEPNAYDVRRTS
jgi:TusA-related sulfurtransferase